MKCKIVVNTTKRFSKHTIPPLLKSLKSAGFDSHEILVMSGGYRKRGWKLLNQNHRKLPFDAIDYTALIELGGRNYGADYYFVMHDTVKVGKEFKEILYSLDPVPWDVIALKNKPSMNIGLYSAEYLKQKNDLLIDLKNYDYSLANMQAIKAWGVINEDYLAWGQNDVATTTYAELLFCPQNGEPTIVGEIDYYGNGITRRIEHYKFLDFYKIKSNWIVKDEYEMDL